MSTDVPGYLTNSTEVLNCSKHPWPCYGLGLPGRYPSSSLLFPNARVPLSQFSRRPATDLRWAQATDDLWFSTTHRKGNHQVNFIVILCHVTKLCHPQNCDCLSGFIRFLGTTRSYQDHTTEYLTVSQSVVNSSVFGNHGWSVAGAQRKSVARPAADPGQWD